MRRTRNAAVTVTVTVIGAALRQGRELEKRRRKEGGKEGKKMGGERSPLLFLQFNH